MPRRRYKKNQGLLDLAFRSDWKLSAFLAAGSLFAAMGFIPSVFGRSPLLSPLALMLTPLAWLFVFVFAGIALLRFSKQQAAKMAPDTSPKANSQPQEGSRPKSVIMRREPTELDRAWLQTTSPDAPPLPARPATWSMEVLDQVEWKRFEDLCCAFYREKGIRAQTTRLGPDGGVDIRLFQDAADPTRATTIVQCKAWSQQVGVKPVRELRGVMAHEKADKGFFMAPRGFTEDARAFATENHITLLDGKLFLAMLQRLPAESSRRLLGFATEGDWTTPTCPSCGARMTARAGKRGPFWGCVSYPKCRGLLPMRIKPATTPEVTNTY